MRGVREGSVRWNNPLGTIFVVLILCHDLVFVETEFTKKQNL